MNTARDTAIDLLTRLLAGERGEVPMQLAMLLEKSSPSDHGDDHYRQILPPEIAGLRLSPETSEEIIETLCAEVSCNPDQALIFVISFTGADLATKIVSEILTNPPRPLTMAEYGAALALVNFFLPDRLAEDPEFLPQTDLVRLIQVVTELRNIEESESDRSERIQLRRLAPQLLKRLKKLGIGGG
jgi:hypothetical protein